MHKALVALVTSSALLSSCASSKFYSDAELKKETGIRVYTPKPYLLVTRNAAKDKPLEASIVYLPNMAEPQYVKYSPGIGSNKFTISLTNGMLTSYGMESDAKIAELVTAVGSLGTVAGGLTKSLADAASVREATAKAKASRQEAADRAVLNSAAKGLKDIADAVTKATPKDLSGRAKTSVDALTTNLTKVIEKLNDPTAVAPTTLADIVKDLQGSVVDQWAGAIEEVVKSQSKTKDAFKKVLEKQKEAVDEVIKKLSAESKKALEEEDTSAPTVELYEIHTEAGKITLVKVK